MNQLTDKESKQSHNKIQIKLKKYIHLMEKQQNKNLPVYENYLTQSPDSH